MTVDHDKNKNRIVDILKADINVFDSGATVGKLREIYVGQRVPKSISGSNSPPFAYVINGNPILTKKPKGIVQNNQQSYFENTVRYLINFVSKTKTRAVDSEKQLDNIELTISTAIENNFQLLDPDSNDDPICIKSFIERVDSLLFTAKKGFLDQGRSLTLNLTIIST